jgi:beta-glucosidase-like glycosyl hydrolase/CubicO group peptidase (beta-lactamase class C family)
MKETMLLLFAGLLASTSPRQTSAQPPACNPLPKLYKTADTARMNLWVDSICSTMTPDEKIGQLFMIVADPKATPTGTGKIRNLIAQCFIGGILFSKGSVQDQATSTNLYRQASRIPLLIALDGEWGLSMRLANTTQFPRNMMLGAIADEKILERYGAEVGRQCRAMGIHLNFAPVLDVNSNPGNPVIGMRSFGENAQRVARHAIAYAEGLEQRGVAAVGKHFPGHGNTTEDSHKTLPTVANNREWLEANDLHPFRSYINAGLSGIMTGHLSVPALDSASHLPASLSHRIVTGLLQDDMKFAGLTVTDALVMKGAQTGKNLCVQALQAGNDLLLNPPKPVEDFKAIKKAIADSLLSPDNIERKCRKILQYKYLLGLNRNPPIALDGLPDRLNSDSAEWICRKLNEEAITLLKNSGDLLPLKAFDRLRIASLSVGDSVNNNFQQTLKQYTRVDAYAFRETSTPAEIDSLFRTLGKYDAVICGIHSAKLPETPAWIRLADRTRLVLCCFIPPYALSAYSRLTASSQAVVMAYEHTPYAREAAAQAIMGGIPMRGTLPVTIGNLFREGTSIRTVKTRLSHQSPLEAGLSPDTLRMIDSTLLNAIREGAFPGCQVLVARNGAVVYHKTFGCFDYAGTHPVTTNDIYDLASVTKIAATLPAVMHLYDRRRIALSDSIGKYVEALKNTDKAAITLREALLHESGLAPFLPFYLSAIDKNSFDGKLFSSRRDRTFRIRYDEHVYARTDFKYLPELVSEKPRTGFSLQVAEHFYLHDGFPSFILRDIAASGLGNKGTCRYSDLNFMLLKEAVENVSRTPLDRYVANTHYKRLGADHTMFQPLKHGFNKANIAPTEDDRVIRNQILIGHVHDEAAAFMGGVSGNAGLFSNANDLAKLAQLFLNNGEYGGERYFDEATCRLFTATAGSGRRGLGFDKPDPAKKPPCLPASVYGHTGYTGTSMWMDPDNQLIYILLTNRVYPARANKKMQQMDIRSQIQEIIYRSMSK